MSENGPKINAKSFRPNGQETADERARSCESELIRNNFSKFWVLPSPPLFYTAQRTDPLRALDTLHLRHGKKEFNCFGILTLCF